MGPYAATSRASIAVLSKTSLVNPESPGPGGLSRTLASGYGVRNFPCRLKLKVDMCILWKNPRSMDEFSAQSAQALDGPSEFRYVQALMTCGPDRCPSSSRANLVSSRYIVDGKLVSSAGRTAISLRHASNVIVFLLKPHCGYSFGEL